jgi:hypothetical protein
MPETFPISWPTKVLPPQNVMFSRKQMSRSGGPSIAGNEQVVSSATDMWRAKLGIKVTRFEQILAFRGMMAQADGRVGTWLIPTCSGFQRLGQGVNGILPAIGVRTKVNAPFSDAATFSDSGAFETKMVMGAVTIGGALRSRTITVQMQGGTPPPLGGHFFSIGQALYQIATAIPVNDDGTTAGPYVLTFRPGLRSVAAIGDVVNFSDPRCRMRLASDDTGELDLDLLRFGSVSLDFVEDPTVS